MEKSERISQGIHKVIKELMDGVMRKNLLIDPFIPENHRLNKPLYAALVPDEIFKGAHFERRFVTPFGNVWEKLARIVAIENHGSCIKGHSLHGSIRAERLTRIHQILHNLEHGTTSNKQCKPDWDAELKYILQGDGELIPLTVVCDIFIENKKENISYAVELKGPLPNSDQTKVSKEKMFKLLAMEPLQVTNAFYAFPYNPYGKKENYTWTVPNRWFNMREDKNVLIGDEFWDMIGGEGTYDNFVKEINSLGKQYKDRIYREILKIEPPPKDVNI